MPIARTLLLVMSALAVGGSVSFRPAQSRVRIDLQQASPDEWSAQYFSTKPISKLVFFRNVGESRSQQWHAETGFAFRRDGDADILSRLDGKPFSRVRVEVPIEFHLIPKEYLPFAHFSDGGLLIYTARFFACPDACDETARKWDMLLHVPSKSFGFAAGKEARHSIGWTDFDQGRYVYVGPARPSVTRTLVSLVDAKLPQDMRGPLQNVFPAIMNALASRLGSLPKKPELFVSYEAVPGHGLTSKGGTLPGQIILTYHGIMPPEVGDKLQFTTWFFAHELTHLFEQEGVAEPSQEWIHEGSAEAFAADIVEKSSPEGRAYAARKIGEATVACEKGLLTVPLKDAAAAGQHGLNYDCGLLLFRRFDKEIQNHGHAEGMALLWRRYRARVRLGASPNEETLYAQLGRLAGPETVRWARNITDAKVDDPQRALSET